MRVAQYQSKLVLFSSVGHLEQAAGDCGFRATVTHAPHVRSAIDVTVRWEKWGGHRALVALLPRQASPVPGPKYD
jgi:hypothetical protein